MSSSLSDSRFKKVEQSIDQYGTYILNYLNSMTRNHADAEDLASQLWITVLEKFPEDQITNLSLLRRKAYQIFVDGWRRKQREKVVAVEMVPDMPIQSFREEPLTDEEESDLKHTFFEEFPVELEPLQQEALWLSARVGLTYKQISEKLGKPQSTIGDWVKQGRIAFAEYLNKQ